jgi:hypothetical protein
LDYISKAISKNAGASKTVKPVEEPKKVTEKEGK